MKEAKLTCFANPNNRNRYYVAPTGDGKSKCFIGRTANGFDFLGYTIHPQRRLRPSSVSLERLAIRARRLYEQRGSKGRLWEYVSYWYRWLHGGLKGLVTRKGGIRRYYIYILRRLRIP